MNLIKKMAALPPTFSFAKLYSDPANGVAEALKVLYAEWRTTDVAPKTSGLEGDVIADFYLPIGAVGIFIGDDISKTGRLKLLHGFGRYTGGVGQADPDRKTNLCLEGDVDDTDILTVPFDPNQLGLTPYVNGASTFVRHLTLLQAELTKPMVEPFGDTDTGIHTVRTRSCMFVPYELVSLLLGQDYTAAEAFDVCYPLLEDEGLGGVCAPFLEFLQVASTQPYDANFRPVTLQDKMGLTRRTIRPAAIRHHRDTMLYQLLPDTRPSATALPDAFAASMSAGLTNIAAEMHADRRAQNIRAVDTSRKKTFWDKYGERIVDGLILLTGASGDELLPPLKESPSGSFSNKKWTRVPSCWGCYHSR
jgi:hypothetical protein